MGIAGAGMSALAELLRSRGATVTGCDIAAEGSDRYLAGALAWSTVMTLLMSRRACELSS
jgi:UDP-N-acetylmuramate-alanine ligase